MKKAFTLIELLVTCTIIAILAALVIPAVNSCIKATHQAQTERYSEVVEYVQKHPKAKRFVKEAMSDNQITTDEMSEIKEKVTKEELKELVERRD